MLTKTGLSDTVEPSSSPENFDPEGRRITHASRFNSINEAPGTGLIGGDFPKTLIGRLFAVEKQAKDMSVAERLALRQTQSVPVLAELRQKVLTWKERLLPKHPMAEAVNYTLSQWEALTVFTSDGAVPIDNNVSEREITRVVLNRKNSLFVGNPRGGRTAAILASLTTSRRRDDMDPQLYSLQTVINT